MKYLSDQENARLQALIAQLLDSAKLGRSCINCVHFSEENEACALAGARPPARVIALGCPQHIEIPPF